jgi:hypothetical protein
MAAEIAVIGALLMESAGQGVELRPPNCGHASITCMRVSPNFIMSLEADMELKWLMESKAAAAHM